MRKKHLLIGIIILVIMLIPIKTELKDGGTKIYNAVLYGITKEHSMTTEDNTVNGQFCYNIGTRIRILWFEVYDDTEFVSLATEK